MKRINERKEDCYKSLKKLENKFITSNFNPKLVKTSLRKFVGRTKMLTSQTKKNIKLKTKTSNGLLS